MKIVTKLLLISALTGSSALAGNPEKYCSKSAKKIDIHLFGYTYDTDSQRKLALQGLTKVKRDFLKGTKVRIFSHSLNGMSVSFDACVPGCNDSSATDQFFNSDCSVQVAKRDFIEFEKKFASVVLRDITAKHDSYDIFQAIQSLSDVYKNTHDQNNVFAVISMVPKGINPNHRNELTALYVKKSETISFPKSFPSVQLIGASSNEELIKFWNDVFRNKAKFNFQEF
jgi:hypothetical protein